MFLLFLLLLHHLSCRHTSIDYGQLRESNWPFQTEYNSTHHVIQPFGKAILHVASKSSYGLRFHASKSNSNKVNMSIIANYNYYTESFDSRCLTDDYTGVYDNYCCTNMTYLNGNENYPVIKDCMLRYETLYTSVWDEGLSMEENEMIWFNDVSYYNQKYDLSNLMNMVTTSLLNTEKKSRFADYNNYLLVAENIGLIPIQIKLDWVIENDERSVPFSYTFFSKVIFSINPGVLLWVFLWIPMISGTFLLFCICVNLCFFCRETKRTEKVEKIVTKKSKKGFFFKREDVIESFSEVTEVKRTYHSLYHSFKQDKKKTLRRQIYCFVRYLIYEQNILELFYLAFSLILKKTNYCIKEDEDKREKVKKFTEKFDSEELSTQKCIFPKKLIYYLCSFFISYFTSLIIRSYILESFVLPDECYLSELVYEDDMILNNDTLRFMPQAKGDMSIEFEPETAFLFPGEIKKNPNSLDKNHPFESYYERVLKSEYGWMNCIITDNETITNGDSRPKCKEAEETYDLWVQLPSRNCNQATDLFNSVFYQILSSIITFFLLTIPLWLFNSSFWWKGGPFFFGTYCPDKCMVVEKKKVKCLNCKICCSGMCFFITLGCFGAMLFLIILQLSFSVINAGDFISQFIVNFIVENLYEYITITFKYFLCCGWKKGQKIVKIENTKTLSSKKIKVENELNEVKVDDINPVVNTVDNSFALQNALDKV